MANMACVLAGEWIGCSAETWCDEKQWFGVTMARAVMYAVTSRYHRPRRKKASGNWKAATECTLRRRGFSGVSDTVRLECDAEPVIHHRHNSLPKASDCLA